jgi:3-phenylpropionate/trans-cinnamate dioxygenase ferredoxin reductase component
MTAARSVDVLLIGGGVAAARCARTLRRRRFAGSILLVGDEHRLPYNRPPLSKELLRGEVGEELITAEPAPWYARQRVDVLNGVAVTELRIRRREAVLDDGSTIGFGRCLLATGAEPRRPSLEGAEHLLLLRTVDDAIRIREHAIAAGQGGSAVVIGGGFIGVEVAASLAAHRLQVTVLERSPQLWRGLLGEVVSSWAVGVLARSGVDVRFGTAATRVENHHVWLRDARIRADLIVAGVGVTPRVALAEQAGLPVKDGLLVDASQSAAGGIFAAGDVARAPNPAAGGAAIRVEHWHTAREAGESAALGMLGEQVPPARAPWVYTEFAAQLLEVVGWAPDRDEERVLGDPLSDRFAVAYLRAGRVAQLAVANGFFAVEDARSFVEARRPPEDLEELTGS